MPFRLNSERILFQKLLHELKCLFYLFSVMEMVFSSVWLANFSSNKYVSYFDQTYTQHCQLTRICSRYATFYLFFYLRKFEARRNFDAMLCF